jgi:uncharacterized protein YbjT (DUF2867 family)
MRLLVTGATGYVGGRLVPRLLAAGHEVRCLVREPGALHVPWRDRVEVVGGAVEDEGAVLRAADGADAAYYLIHGMQDRLAGLLDRETRAAASFREGAELGGVQRIVYLGGLVDEAELARTSPHLYARQQVGQTLRAGSVPVTELRAGIVIGAGSASFELLRAAAALPVTLRAPFSRSWTQPIAESDLLDVLLAVLDDPAVAWDTLELGGPDVVTYGELVARVRAALNRVPARELPVPYLPPELAGTAASTLTRLDPELVLPLLRSADLDAVVRDDHARRRYPGLLRTRLYDAIADALFGPADRPAPTSEGTERGGPTL